MKTIYILLTKSDTFVSKLIGLFTSEKFTHVSISFDETLQPMYSFARKIYYTPLPAGLRNEPFDKGFFKHNDYIPCELYKLEVEDKAYYEAKKRVERMIKRKDDYRFNIIGLFLCRLNIPYKRKRHYFCSQFVSEILEESHALKLPKETGIMHPSDFRKIPELKLIFRGNMRQLSIISHKRSSRTG